MLALLPKTRVQLIPKPAWANQLSYGCSTQNHLCPKWSHLSEATLSLQFTSQPHGKPWRPQRPFTVPCLPGMTQCHLSWQGLCQEKESRPQTPHTVLTPSLKISSEASEHQWNPANHQMLWIMGATHDTCQAKSDSRCHSAMLLSHVLPGWLVKQIFFLILLGFGYFLWWCTTLTDFGSMGSIVDRQTVQQFASSRQVHCRQSVTQLLLGTQCLGRSLEMGCSCLPSDCLLPKSTCVGTRK